MSTKAEKDNFIVEIETILGFNFDYATNKYSKYYAAIDTTVEVDAKAEKLIYPEDKGFIVNDKTTSNFDHPENFVVFECVNRLFDKGYRPESIALETKWKLGHDSKSGKADITIKDINGIDVLAIIECKTYGTEYNKELSNLNIDGGQLFSYWQQERSTKWLVLYTSKFESGKLEYKTESVDCSDDGNILALLKKDNSIKVYKNASKATELFECWDETYDKRMVGDVLFRDDSVAYNVGAKPLRNKDLVDFSEDDKVVNKFEEILRHNNVSDKENAFNRLIALFICKLVDEIQKNTDDIVDFQYKVGTDTYESLQDRLQKLHAEGMEKFMREKIFYVSDDYAEKLIRTYTGKKREKMIEELRNTLRILKFYTNNDFAFKDVHNEELFYQNGKILVEVVQLFEKFRIIGSSNLQLLGDLFEQLLNKGFKQNEGQFFTPIPITRFIWNSLPLENSIYLNGDAEAPKVIDYACGAGHFLTEGYEAICEIAGAVSDDNKISKESVENNLFGIEKDYRLARVSKISLFMHGAGNGNIVFGDGLEDYPEKGVEPLSFDILVANPPYSVSGFKPHLKLKNNDFRILKFISNTGSEIETLFVERISQLLKPMGIAAVVLPSSILSKENESYVAAREELLQNFEIKAIVQLGSKTFGATGTTTDILFLKKFNEPPKRINMVIDSVESIFRDEDPTDWEDKEIICSYLEKNSIPEADYKDFIGKVKNYNDWVNHSYFSQYYNSFTDSSIFANVLKKKSYKNAPPDEQQNKLNGLFYNYAFEIEREKLFYFGLVYMQTTLIITSPDANKEQERFLGYKWSNRKGNEGIQIISPGGELYNDSNRRSDGNAASLIRHAFNNEKSNSEQLGEHYYYLRLQDMIDFYRIPFNKAIKTSKVRIKKPKDGFELYKLSSKEFSLFIGERVLQTEITNAGTPVISANVHEIFGYTAKKSKNVQDFNQDSVLWGIDGDWMTSFVPAGKEFYPTDHCGVLRINTDKIMPKYMKLALENEGLYEGFSRSYRASQQRIKDLSLLVPAMDKQQEIVQEFDELDNKLKATIDEIKKYNDSMMEKFMELFGDPRFNVNAWDKKTLRELSIGGLTYGSGASAVAYDGDSRYIRITDINDNGELNNEAVSPNTFDSKYLLNDGDILFARSGATVGKTFIYRSYYGKAIYAGYLIRCVPDKTQILPEYLDEFTRTRYYYDFIHSTELGNRTTAQANISADKYGQLLVMCPPIPEQRKYVTFAVPLLKKRYEASVDLEQIMKQRKNLLKATFD